MSEEWRPVVGNVGRYEVSSLGRVRSLDRDVVRSGRIHRLSGRILSPRSNGKYGYLNVHLGRDHREYVHRLVAEAFIGAVRGFDVDHRDGDVTNNRVDNLRILSHAENMAAQRERKPECKRGHSMADAYVTPDGRRNCRACRRESDKRRRKVGAA